MTDMIVFALAFEDLDSFKRMTRQKGFVKGLRDMAQAYEQQKPGRTVSNFGYVCGKVPSAHAGVFCIEGTYWPNTGRLQEPEFTTQFVGKENVLHQFHNIQVKKRVLKRKKEKALAENTGQMTIEHAIWVNERADARRQRRAGANSQGPMFITFSTPTGISEDIVVANF